VFLRIPDTNKLSYAELATENEKEIRGGITSDFPGDRILRMETHAHRFMFLRNAPDSGLLSVSRVFQEMQGQMH